MRIVVIGGTGFIGGEAVRQLAGRGHELLTVQRHHSIRLAPPIRQVLCDQLELANAAGELRAFQADVVVDFVSSSARQALATVETFAGHAGHLIAISSQDVYRAFALRQGLDEGPLEPVPITEDSPHNTCRLTYPPQVVEQMKKLFGWVTSEYSNGAMEEIALKAPGLPCTVLRLPMVYGPGDYLHRCYPILKRVDDGRSVIPIADTVAQWRGPRGYIQDVAWATVLATEKPGTAGTVFNVAEEQNYSELEWARLVADAAGFKGTVGTIPYGQAPSHLRPPGNFAQQCIVESRRIREQLAYAEITPREVALERTIAWERAHPPDPAPQFDYAAEDAVLSQLSIGARP